MLLRAGLDHAANAMLHCGTHHVVGAQSIDTESLHGVRPYDGAVDDRIHSLACRKDLGIVANIDHPLFVWGGQERGERRTSGLRTVFGPHIRQRANVGLANEVSILNLLRKRCGDGPGR